MKTADCGVFFTAQSPKPPILASQSHGQLVALCDCVAKTVRMKYHHRELCFTMGDFYVSMTMALSEIGEREGEREGESGYVRIFLGTSITTYFKKRHVEHFIVFF